MDGLIFRYDRLDAWMEARGLSSAEVADVTELSYNYLYMLRLGRRPNVSAQNVAKIALAVGCTMDYLCNVSDDPMGRGNLGGEEEISLLLAFRPLPVHRQRDVVIIAHAFGGQGEEDAEQTKTLLLGQIEQVYGEAIASQVLDVLGQSAGAAVATKTETGRGVDRLNIAAEQAGEDS